jgi:hypothetical protein
MTNSYWFIWRTACLNFLNVNDSYLQKKKKLLMLRWATNCKGVEPNPKFLRFLGSHYYIILISHFSLVMFNIEHRACIRFEMRVLCSIGCVSVLGMTLKCRPTYGAYWFSFWNTKGHSVAIDSPFEIPKATSVDPKFGVRVDSPFEIPKATQPCWLSFWNTKGHSTWQTSPSWFSFWNTKGHSTVLTLLLKY